MLKFLHPYIIKLVKKLKICLFKTNLYKLVLWIMCIVGSVRSIILMVDMAVVISVDSPLIVL